MAANVLRTALVQLAEEGDVAGLVARQVGVGGAQEERVIALVAAVLQERGRLGIGAGDDDAGHPHDVQLHAGRAEALDLLVR